MDISQVLFNNQNTLYSAIFREHQNLLHDTLEGRMLGKATKGRKPLHMLSDISCHSYQDLKKETGERSSWKMMLSKTCH